MNLMLCLLVVLSPTERGPTTPFETTVCARTELADETREEWLQYRKPLPDPAPGSGFNWIPVDSFALSGELGPGARVIITHALPGDSLEIESSLTSLSAREREALAWAPDWLTEGLTSTFRRLGDSAEFYADLLLAAPDPYTDEVAFCIANIGPEVLTHPLFNPDLLLLNAEQLYEVDDSLRYADIIDHGSSPGDYYSTVRYAVLDHGDTVRLELPRDIYYHYVVHPTTSDEMPRLDDYVLNKHWREYFFFEADSGFPLLCDYIKRAEVVWARRLERYPSGREFEPDDYALDVIGNWVDRTITSGASGNRPIHPNVIAHEHNGNCGEIQDMMTAACRTCLIPAVNCSDPCEDHVWNEFWDGHWYPYALDRTTRIADSACGYEELHGGSKRISAVWNWRPDGFWWTVTREYSLTCSLHVRALDQRGLPIDGARVIISSEGWVGGLSTTTIGFTDSDGAVAFELGDLRNFYARVSTPIGYYPSPDSSVKIINYSQTGAHYYKTFCIPACLPAPVPTPRPHPGDSLARYKLELELDMASGLDYGYCIARGSGSGDPDDTVRIYQYYSDPHPAPTGDVFAVDTAGYARYLAGSRFSALLFHDNVPNQTVSFTCPLYSNQYYLMLSNEDKLHASRWLQSTARLYMRAPGIAAPGTLDPLTPFRAAPTVFRNRLVMDFKPGTAPLTVQVFNVTGRLIEEHNLGPKQGRIESALKAGVYLLLLSDGSRTWSSKAVVTH